MESDKEDARQQLEGAVTFQYWSYYFYLQERILLRTFMAFESEIASAMSVSE